MDNEYRVGGSLGTTIFRGPKTPDQQPIGIVFNLPVDEARDLAWEIVCYLNNPEPDDGRRYSRSPQRDPAGSEPPYNRDTDG